jgi:hypothetical protein
MVGWLEQNPDFQHGKWVPLRMEHAKVEQRVLKPPKKLGFRLWHIFLSKCILSHVDFVPSQ